MFSINLFSVNRFIGFGKLADNRLMAIYSQRICLTLNVFSMVGRQSLLTALMLPILGMYSNMAILNSQSSAVYSMSIVFKRTVYCPVGTEPDYKIPAKVNAKVIAKPNSTKPLIIIGPQLIDPSRASMHIIKETLRNPHKKSGQQMLSSGPLANLARLSELPPSELVLMGELRMRGVTGECHWTEFNVDPTIAYLLLEVAHQAASIAKPNNSITTGLVNRIIDVDAAQKLGIAKLLALPSRYDPSTFSFLIPHRAWEILNAFYFSPGAKCQIETFKLGAGATSMRNARFLFSSGVSAKTTDQATKDFQQIISLQYCILLAAMLEFLGLGRGLIQVQSSLDANKQINQAYGSLNNLSLSHQYHVRSIASPEFLIMGSDWYNVLSRWEINQFTEDGLPVSAKSGANRLVLNSGPLALQDWNTDVILKAFESDLFVSVLFALNNGHLDSWERSYDYGSCNTGMRLPISCFLNRGLILDNNWLQSHNKKQLLKQPGYEPILNKRMTVLRLGLAIWLGHNVAHYNNMMLRSIVKDWNNHTTIDTHFDRHGAPSLRVYRYMQDRMSAKLAPFTLVNVGLSRPLVHPGPVMQLFNASSHQYGLLNVSQMQALRKDLVPLAARLDNLDFQNNPPLDHYLPGIHVANLINQVLIP